MQKVAIKILEKKLRQNALERRLVEASKVMPAFLPCKPRRGKPEPLQGANASNERKSRMDTEFRQF